MRRVSTSYFVDEGAEEICPRPHSQEVAELRTSNFPVLPYFFRNENLTVLLLKITFFLKTKSNIYSNNSNNMSAGFLTELATTGC